MFAVEVEAADKQHRRQPARVGSAAATPPTATATTIRAASRRTAAHLSSGSSPAVGKLKLSKELMVRLYAAAMSRRRQLQLDEQQQQQCLQHHRLNNEAQFSQQTHQDQDNVSQRRRTRRQEPSRGVNDKSRCCSGERQPAPTRRNSYASAEGRTGEYCVSVAVSRRQ